MRFLRNRAVLLLVLTLVGGALFAIRSLNAETNADGKKSEISSGEISSPLQVLSVHLAENHYVTVKSKTFKHVRGLPPYYIRLPQLESILFITGRTGKTGTLHVFDLRRNLDTKIEGLPERFGWRMDGNTTTNGSSFETVSVVGTNQLVINLQIYRVLEKVLVNLADRNFTISRTVE